MTKDMSSASPPREGYGETADIYTKRPVSYEEALGCLGRLINSHFRNPGEHMRASIPANPDRDDDLLLSAFIRQQRTAAATARSEAYEACAAFHDAEAAKLKARLERATARRDIRPTDIVLGDSVLSFSGNHVGELREALRNDIAVHEMCAKAIRTLATRTPLAVSPDPSA